MMQESFWSCIEMGRMLAEAKEKLTRREFGVLLDEMLPFVQDMDVLGMMRVGTHPVLGDRRRMYEIPPSPRIVIILSALTERQALTAIRRGWIHPAMLIADAEALVKRMKRRN
jgi:hypothetical protein